MPFVELSDGTRLFYSEFGQGVPIVFSHSWGLNSDMYNYQIPPLAAAGYRCIAYDRRGHGRSDWTPGGYDYDQSADDLAQLLEALKLSEVTLVGHSMGAGEIVRYVTRHGTQRLARTILIAPTTPWLPRSDDNPDGLAPELTQLTVAALLRDVPAWCEENRVAFFGDRVVSPGTADWVSRQIVQTPLMVLLQTLTNLGADLRAELPKLNLPTLILQGDLDASAPLALTGKRTAALAPRAQLVVYEGAGHGLYVTDHARVTADIVAFIRTGAPSGN